jgi:hypothetical protein
MGYGFLSFKQLPNPPMFPLNGIWKMRELMPNVVTQRGVWQKLLARCRAALTGNVKST